MGYEDRLIRGLDQRNPGELPVIVEMYKKAQEILQEDSIDPENFVDLYGEANVARDVLKVNELKAKFENDATKRTAEVLEAIIYKRIELGNWLGPNAETIRPSEYDDFVNGIDIIVEFNTEDSKKHLALGIDITFGSLTMVKKFDRIKEEIDMDELAKVKYFEAHGFKGTLTQLPRIVIGVQKDTVVDLAGLWMNNKNTEIDKHFIKDILLQEIKLQLETFLAYAEKHKKQNAILSYQRALRTLNGILTSENNENRVRNLAISEDAVFKAIKEELSTKFIR